MSERKPMVFISHAADDEPTARAIASALDTTGVEYFLESAGLESGENWKESVLSSLTASSIYVLVVSPTSVNSSSAQFETGFALARAREEGAKILPVVVEDASLPSSLIDFYKVDAEHAGPTGVAAAIKRLVDETK